MASKDWMSVDGIVCNKRLFAYKKNVSFGGMRVSVSRERTVEQSEREKKKRVRCLRRGRGRMQREKGGRRRRKSGLDVPGRRLTTSGPRDRNRPLNKDSQQSSRVLVQNTCTNL